MALVCENCGRGIGYGHAVSHAKNRVRRIFKPNIQKLKVLRDGAQKRVKLCTRCIQKMKKVGSIGIYKYIYYMKADDEVKAGLAKAQKIEEAVVKASASAKATADKSASKEEALKIEDIVGKK